MSYDRQIKNTLALIKRKGQTITWRQIVEGSAPDPSQPHKTNPSTIINNFVDIVFLPITRQQKRSLQYKTNSEVPKGSLMGYMGAVDFEPDLNDIVIRDGKELRISNIDITAPDNNPILYMVEFDL